MSKTTLIASQMLLRAHCDAIREQVGPGRSYSQLAVAEACAIDERVVRSYVAGDTAPSLGKFLSIAALLGPVYLNQVLRVAGFDGARRVDPAGSVTDRDLNADMAGAMAQLAAALRDGRVDHAERPAVMREMRLLQIAVADWIQQSEAAQRGELVRPMGRA